MAIEDLTGWKPSNNIEVIEFSSSEIVDTYAGTLIIYDHDELIEFKNLIKSDWSCNEKMECYKYYAQDSSILIGYIRFRTDTVEFIRYDNIQ